MATAKKASKKPAARKRVKKPVRRLPIGKCKDVGNELKHRGTSAADDEIRAHGGVCLVKRRQARKVKTKTFIVRPRADARRARLARAAKRKGARSAEKNGADAALTSADRAALDAFAREFGRTWKSKLLRMRATLSGFPMNYPGAYRAFQHVGPRGIRAYSPR